MDQPIISVKGLHKKYKTNHVLKGINLEVSPGQIIGYIGPNGAGKSTTVRILAGLDSKFEGEVNILGMNVQEQALEVKKHIGYIPENAALYDVLTPKEFLSFIGQLYEMPKSVIERRIKEMLQFFKLNDNIDQRLETFSKGMRQKVLLISGLMHDPKIIFLDEPLAGLDANSVILFKELLARLAASGKTIFYSSHMMDVVEKVSDRIILIHEGNIIADDNFEKLKAQGGESLERVFAQLTGGGSIDNEIEGFLKVFDPANSENE